MKTRNAEAVWVKLLHNFSPSIFKTSRFRSGNNVRALITPQRWSCHFLIMFIKEHVGKVLILFLISRM